MRKDTLGYITDIARELRKNQTAAERILWEKLRNRKLDGYKFRRQYGIGRYIADFYCSETPLVVELDGGIHNCTTQQEYDEIRNTAIIQREIRILRIKSDEALCDVDKVIERIRTVLNSPSPDAGEGAGG